MLEQFKLDGKVAIITGGAQGVGFGIAKVLSKAGAHVLLTGRTQTPLDKAVGEIETAGGKALAVVADACKTADNQRTIQTALEQLGHIDILVNNVARSYASPFFDITVKDFEETLRHNLLSAFELTQMAAPHMKQNGGSVINISSRTAQIGGGSNYVAYSVSKAALEQLTRTMAWELAPDIRVNAISIGVVQSEGWERGYRNMSEEARKRFMLQVPLQKVGSPESIGLAALYLCSEDCYATAEVMVVDGGLRGPML